MPAGVIKLATDENAHVPFVTVLDGFNAQEHRGADHRDQQVKTALLVLA